jgi:2-keto-4-pentenoate hydratase/2-oxohepta-3-ene-1,7-dioic acid hydratase in catechol pathway
MITLPIAGASLADRKSVVINPSKIIAVGLNYLDHIKESVTGQAVPHTVPTEPVLFAKTSNVIIGPGQPIVIPHFIDDYHFAESRVDPEAELAIIIAKRARHVPQDRAFDYVLGYTCFNDVSQRNFQNTDASGWFRGKSLDSFGPIGPVVVLHKDIGDPQKLAVCSRINGVLKQQGNTKDMIFSIPALIAFISKNFTLEEGDIIATGTPSGISPIKAGDTVEVEIEGIGILQNPVSAGA